MAGLNSSRSSPLNPPKQASLRSAGYSRVCMMFIMSIGFLLVISYQAEIYSAAGVVSKWEYGTMSKSISYVSNSRVEETRNKVEPIKQVFKDAAKISTESSTELSDTQSRVTLQTRDPTLRLKTDDSVMRNKSDIVGHRKAERSVSGSKPGRNSRRSERARGRSNGVKKDYEPSVEDIQSNVISKKFRLVIKVLAFNEYGPIVRCLNSLAAVEYAGDNVDIDIYIDHFKLNLNRERGMGRAIGRSLLDSATVTVNSSAEALVAMRTIPGNSDEEKLVTTKVSVNIGSTGPVSGLERKYVDEVGQGITDKVDTETEAVRVGDWGLIEKSLRDSRRILSFVDQFEWLHGTKAVHYRSKNAGIQTQWLDAWWPSSDNEFALVVEDDVEISPLFYRYVRSLIATYYYKSSQYDPSIYGISLQRPQLVPGKNGQALKVGDRTRLFLYQMVGAWGQVLFPKPWKEFRLWYDSHKSQSMEPILEGMVTTDWYRKFGDRIWTPWFLKFVHARGYFNIYTNFLKERALSVSHRSKEGYYKSFSGCDSALIWKNGTRDLDMWHVAPMNSLKRYDFCFKELLQGRFARKLSQLYQILISLHVKKTVLLVSILGVPDPVVRNWLCMLGKWRVSNYLVVGEDEDLLSDFSTRGHSVLQVEKRDLSNDSFVQEANVVLAVLKLGYNVWFTRADSVWIGYPLSDHGAADVIGVENSDLDLFFLNSNKQTINLWYKFCKDLSQGTNSTSKDTSREVARLNFATACEMEKRLRVHPLTPVRLVSVGKFSPRGNVDLPRGSAQVVLLHEMTTWKHRDIISRLKRLALWKLDDDLACQVSCQSR